MKTAIRLLFVIASLSTGLNAFAGPEEHIANQTCYMMSPDQVYIPSQHVPLEICLEKMALHTETAPIDTISYFQPELFQDLKITSLLRKNEDYFSFKAASTFFDEQSPCGNGERNQLLISGLSDNYGSVDIKNLQVSVLRQTTKDSCHSNPETKIFTYILK